MNEGEAPGEACLWLNKPLVLDRTPGEVLPSRTTPWLRGRCKAFPPQEAGALCNARVYPPVALKNPSDLRKARRDGRLPFSERSVGTSPQVRFEDVAI